VTPGAPGRRRRRRDVTRPAPPPRPAPARRVLRPVSRLGELRPLARPFPPPGRGPVNVPALVVGLVGCAVAAALPVLFILGVLALIP